MSDYLTSLLLVSLCADCVFITKLTPLNILSCFGSVLLRRLDECCPVRVLFRQQFLYDFCLRSRFLYTQLIDMHDELVYLSIYVLSFIWPNCILRKAHPFAEDLENLQLFDQLHGQVRTD